MCRLASVVDVIEVQRGDDAQGLPGDFEVAGQGAEDLAIQGHLQPIIGIHVQAGRVPDPDARYLPPGAQ